LGQSKLGHCQAGEKEPDRRANSSASSCYACLLGWNIRRNSSEVKVLFLNCPSLPYHTLIADAATPPISSSQVLIYAETRHEVMVRQLSSNPDSMIGLRQEGKGSPDALRRSAFPGSFFASVVSCNGIVNPIFFRLLVGFLASLVTEPGASGNAQV